MGVLVLRLVLKICTCATIIIVACVFMLAVLVKLYMYIWELCCMCIYAMCGSIDVHVHHKMLHAYICCVYFKDVHVHLQELRCMCLYAMCGFINVCAHLWKIVACVFKVAVLLKMYRYIYKNYVACVVMLCVIVWMYCTSKKMLHEFSGYVCCHKCTCTSTKTMLHV